MGEAIIKDTYKVTGGNQVLVKWVQDPDTKGFFFTTEMDDEWEEI